MVRKATVTMAANATATELGTVYQGGMIQIGGTFGGGTLALLISLDGGTTKNALKDLGGTAYTTTAPDTFTFSLPLRDDQQIQPRIYATLTGATSPSISIIVIDMA